MENELYDIYLFWHVPFWQTREFFIGLISVAGLIVSLFLYWLFKKWRARKKTQTAWDSALATLAQLKKDNKVSVLHGKEFYYALTNIMKVYMHARYGDNLKSATDEEFLAGLANQATVSPAILADIREIMDGVVFIKFANASAAQKKIDADYERAIQIIKNSIPRSRHSKSC